MENHTLSFIDKIGRGQKTAIIGTSWAADIIEDCLKRLRPDVQIVCYIDSFKEGEHKGLKIYKPAELVDLKDKIDTVIISTYSRRHLFSLYCDLAGIKNHVIMTKDDMDYLSAKRNEMFSDIFYSDEDKILYKTVSQARVINEDYSQVAELVKPKLEEKIEIYPLEQYFEFVNKDAVKTVIDGGACNLIHSLLFKRNFPNCKKIYAFEPSYELCKNEIYDEFVKMDDTIEIINKGLWKKDAELTFREDTFSPTGSNIVDVNAGVRGNNDNFKTIGVTSIDSFVKQKNIQKLDYIKMDIENAEYDALTGAMDTIKKHRPQMAISIYHTIEQFQDIPELLNKELDDYIFRLGHYTDTWLETVLYAIPKELYLSK